ncbi:MAG: RNB domain-containing ribonuclease [Deltaproteobacteria bacterium]|jgi:exoribonuclease-2|nr:RNB domain-containing ribonuclease [Deltaproteobacteria bacterium]
MLVEYLKDGNFILSFARKAEDGENRCLVEDGGTLTRLRPNRVLVESLEEEPAGREDKLKLIEETGKRRDALAKMVDLETLWDILEGEGESFPYPYLAELAFGAGSGPDETSAVMRAVSREGTRFRFTPGEALRNSQEEMEAMKSRREAEEAKQRSFSEGEKWLRLSLKAETPADLAAVPAPSKGVEEHFLKNLIDFALSEQEKKEFLKYRDLLESMGFPPDPGGARDLLKRTGVFSPHENIELRRLRLPLEFPAEVMKEAEELSLNQGYLEERRLDLSGVFTLAVDSPGAMEYDDALSLEPREHGGWILGIHIADPAGFILPGSALDRHARVRTSSIYLPETSHPMLPRVLTEGLLSLKKDSAPRPSLVLLIELGEDMRLLNFSFLPGLTRVDAHLTFQEADEALASAGHVTEKLKGLLEISRSFLKKRLGQGGYLFNLPQRQIRVDEKGDVEFSLLTFDSLSYNMLGELMILANNLAALNLKHKNLPCPYRFQSLFKSQSVNAAEKAPEDPFERFVWNLSLRRRLGRSGVSLEPSRHRGLGLPVYTYFSSPMRRYFDMLTHRQLRSLAAGKDSRHPAYGRAAMEAEILYAEKTLKAVHRAQQARERYWLTWLLQGKKGESFKAVVYERRGDKAQICLPDYMLDVELQDPSLAPGTLISLVLKEADAGKNILRFALGS